MHNNEFLPGYNISYTAFPLPYVHSSFHFLQLFIYYSVFLFFYVRFIQLLYSFLFYCYLFKTRIFNFSPLHATFYLCTSHFYSHGPHSLTPIPLICSQIKTTPPVPLK
jgi:hypothetical protein